MTKKEYSCYQMPIKLLVRDCWEVIIIFLLHPQLNFLLKFKGINLQVEQSQRQARLASQ